MYSISENEKKSYYKENTFFNKNKNKVVVYNTFNKHDIITYKNKKFVAFRFYCPLNQLKEVTFVAGKKRDLTVFEEDYITLDSK